MVRKTRQAPPRHHQKATAEPANLLELDRFSAADIDRWQHLSNDLDELNGQLYFGAEPQRQRYRSEMLAALQAIEPAVVELSGWCRIVTYQFSNSPLSAAGSLTSVGGRFNVGMDVDKAVPTPWPALYLATDMPTAFREKFQMTPDADTGGLSANELALVSNSSFACVGVRGRVQRAFDLTSSDNLHGLAKVLTKIKLPQAVPVLARKLRYKPGAFKMVRSATGLHAAIFERNWRVGPVQFGLPSISQISAELIRAAGFEGIKYLSTKDGGACLALFPDRIDSEATFVELQDSAPMGTRHRILNLDTAHELCGWELLRPGQRPEQQLP